MPIGKGETTTNFRLYKLNVQKGDMLYLYTDGYADQFGGPKGKKFKESNFKKLLQRVHSLPISVQKQNIETEIEDWMNDHEQVDDICIIGIRL
jgi:serine phosphatase RsbU (regulator of sigma subunit)